MYEHARAPAVGPAGEVGEAQTGAGPVPGAPAGGTRRRAGVTGRVGPSAANPGCGTDLVPFGPASERRRGCGEKAVRGEERSRLQGDGFRSGCVRQESAIAIGCRGANGSFAESGDATGCLGDTGGFTLDIATKDAGGVHGAELQAGRGPCEPGEEASGAGEAERAGEGESVDGVPVNCTDLAPDSTLIEREVSFPLGEGTWLEANSSRLTGALSRGGENKSDCGGAGAEKTHGAMAGDLAVISLSTGSAHSHTAGSDTEPELSTVLLSALESTPSITSGVVVPQPAKVGELVRSESDIALSSGSHGPRQSAGDMQGAVRLALGGTSGSASGAPESLANRLAAAGADDAGAGSAWARAFVSISSVNDFRKSWTSAQR